MQQFKAFTFEANGVADAIQTQCGVCEAVHFSTNPQIKFYDAIWDTGATRSAISPKIVQELDLKIVSKGTAHTAAGTIIVDMYAINVVLPCNIGITSVLVSCNDLGDTDMLIGMDIITKGDFAITNVDGKTVCSFRVPSIKKIDYVEESTLLEKYAKIHAQWIKSGNYKCPCGSGKRWEQCHGK